MKRIIGVLLILLMLGAVLAGCRNPDKNETTTADSVSTTTSDNNLPARAWDDLPKTNFSDSVGAARDFTLLTGGFASPWNKVDFSADSGGDTLESAVFARTLAVQGRHGVKLKVTNPGGNLNTFITGAAMAEYNDYDLYNIPMRMWGGLVLDGTFKNLRSLDHINWQDPWWNQNFINEMTMYNQLYGVISDVTYLDKLATWLVYFNANVALNHDLGNFYDLVRNNEWTVDKMKSLAMEVAVDNNRDGIVSLDDGDIYGICGEDYNIQIFLQGAGVKVVSYADNNITMMDGNEVIRAEQVFTKVFDLVADSLYTRLANKYPAPGGTLHAGGRAFFEKDQALFHVSGGLTAYNYFRNFITDWGVLPIPKYDENQDNYYSGITSHQCPMLGVPSNVRNPEMTAIVLQALACKGRESVVPVFYNTIMKGQVLRDSDSREMLDLIFDNRTYDLSMIYEIGAGKFEELINTGNKSGFTGTYDGYKNTADSKIASIVGFYDKNYEG